MNYLGLALFAFVASSALAQDGRVYRCMKDGVRYYKSQPMENAECEVITYSGLASPVAGQGWIPLAYNDDVTSYYRTKGLVRKGNIVSLWMRDDYFEKKMLRNAGYYQSEIGRWSIDCSEQTYRRVQSTYYTEKNGQGDVVGQLLFPQDASPLYATPGSIGETMVDTACRISEPKPKAK